MSPGRTGSLVAQLKDRCPPHIRSLIRHWRKKIRLRQYGFDVSFRDDVMTVVRDGCEVYAKPSVQSLNDSSYGLAILKNWPRLRERGFEVTLARNSIALARDGIEVHIRQVDKQPYLTDCLRAVVDHWESIAVDEDGGISSIAGVAIAGTTASTTYKGVGLEYEVSRHWMQHDLEEVFFFSDILPNYLNGVQLQPHHTVFDLGGYHGLFSMAAAVTIGGEARVYCFEPDPENRNVIRRNLERNRITNVEILPMVVSGQRGRRLFIRSASFSSHVAANQREEESDDACEVESTTLWDFCDTRSILKPDFVKADIEGSEIDMIEGNRNWIAQHPVTFSIASYHRVDGEPTWVRLEEVFRELGYSVWTIHSGHTTTIAKPAPPCVNRRPLCRSGHES